MLVMLSIMALVLSSCGKKVEKDIAFYNETTFTLEEITLGTEKTRLDDEKKLVILDYGEDSIAEGGVSAIIFTVPEKELKESWFIHVQGGDGVNSFGTEEELGTIFTDNIDGIKVNFDLATEKFTYEIVYE